MQNKFKLLPTMLCALVILVITLVLLFSPILLYCSDIEGIIRQYLAPLKLVEYKVVYIEVIGGVFGTFLAITGALATQRYFDEKKEKQNLVRSSLIIKYDLCLAFDDLIIAYNEKFLNNGMIIRDLYLYDKWIDVVSNLKNDDSILKECFILYGELHSLKDYLHKGINWPLVQAIGSVEFAVNRTQKLYKKYFTDEFFTEMPKTCLIDNTDAEILRNKYLREKYKKMLESLN